MQRYFLNQPPTDGDLYKIEGEDFHHLTRVMRMKKGDSVYIVFSDGQVGIAEIQDISNEQATVTIVQWINESSELPIHVTIASGLPKGDKLELVIQKGTELGASRFIPFIADRSVVKWDKKKEKKKVERWGKIAKEAAEQCHRSQIPIIEPPMDLQRFIQISEHYQYKLFAYEEEAKQGESEQFYTTLSKIKKKESLLIVFGPEGGFSDREAEILKDCGFLPVGLGPRILRTETAPLYALSAISYHLELMR
ncbi:16S rRNA (uracil1498-N3)-methyltransferase [Oikeobacillus pervagus]|uniref:Ribosomal RNA small subunit methyltransferase E n=1 Tax=Oikeobacillus pervagus TaxID=1325931 RepID=A0AAJ1WHS8_9BACI|nr:16S rRNA (uracil(1498)-N(3))-methyltransferase [Oikeobacillus pervagus]MDQ0213930.1 16S rRNA (uracil1498-N3)-methyltransferase [Oikeobacillus pervagus]